MAQDRHDVGSQGGAVVLDIGSGVIRAGFAGEDTPKAVFQNVVGRPRHTKAMTGGTVSPEETLVGERVIRHRGLLNLRRPINHGFVEQWEDLQHIVSAVFDRDHLNVPLTETPVLLMEHSFQNVQQRKQLCELFLEELHCPAIRFASSGPLALYATGRTTGMVIDCGDGVSQATPIYDGYVIDQGNMRTDLAGRDVTKQLRMQLRKRGYMFHSSADQDIVREIKEGICVVSTDPHEDESAVAMDEYPTKMYTLPDGQLIELSAETFRAPEILFKPTLAGSEEPALQTMIHDAISAANVDLRRELYRNIVLCGGSSFFEGFGNRLLKEVKTLAPKGIKIRMSAAENRDNLPWLGGSIFASVGASAKNWLTKQAYDDGLVEDFDKEAVWSRPRRSQFV